MPRPFIGQIEMFGGTFAPRDWALCNGQLLAIAQHQSLFSILGTIYGGDGRQTFGLPDLRGRVPVHAGTGPGLPVMRLGQKGGRATIVLTAANLPRHNHGGSIGCSSGNANQETPAGHVLAKSEKYASRNANATPQRTSNLTISPDGGNRAFSIMQPYSSVNFIIALRGVFPSRR